MLDKEKLKDYSEDEIKDAVASEYSDDLYKDNKIFLLDNWGKISREIESAFLKSSLICQEEYIIYLNKIRNGR